MRIWSFLGATLVVATGCGSSGQQVDAGGGDAPPDAASAYTISASPTTFDLKVGETRDTTLTLSNNTAQPLSIAGMQATGLTLGTLTLSNQTCLTPLAPGGSCTVGGKFDANTVGQETFDITVSSNAGGTATIALTAKVNPP